MNQKLKQTIKQFGFAVACVRAARAAQMDVRRLFWLFRPSGSEDLQLRGIESHQQCYDVEGINDFETMVVEARKQ